MSEDEKRIAYAKQHDIHHLFELMATKVLMERPENPFAFLRHLLSDVEESTAKKSSYDPTKVQFAEPSVPVPAAPAMSGLPPVPPPAKPKEKRKITLATFGLDNAGKTTMLAALGGNIDDKCTPTVGFNPVHFQLEEANICIFDLGGAANFRGIWVHYFHDCQGVVFVIDSAAPEEQVEVALRVLKETMQHPYVAGKPLLVLANKKDLPLSRGVEVVPEGYLDDILGDVAGPYRVVATCSLVEDDDLDEGIEWLIQTVNEHYDMLVERVANDSEKVKEEKARQRAERLAALNAGSS